MIPFEQYPFLLMDRPKVVSQGEKRPYRRYKHVFLDAEGTLYVPRSGMSRWYFWAEPSPEEAVRFFELDRGVAEALKRLRSETETLCLVSLNTEPVLNAVLNHFGIGGYFDSIMVNGDKGKRIANYLKQRGFRKEDALMVGDTPSLDIYPVLRAGINAILVDRDYNRSAHAERISGVFDLPSWLRCADIADEMARTKVRNSTLDEFGAKVSIQSEDTKNLIAASGA